jgi:hypothetical protein
MRTPEKAFYRERPLTTKKSFLEFHQPSIAKQKRDTMKVTEFAHEYDKFNANNIGPGPAAYQPVQNLPVR